MDCDAWKNLIRFANKTNEITTFVQILYFTFIFHALSVINKIIRSKLQAIVVIDAFIKNILGGMKKQSEIKDSFSRSLRNCLNAYYGKIPSASTFAKDFNLRAYGTSPITQESARRWMRGVSLPEEDRLCVLINWLNLDFNEILRSPHNQAAVFKQNGGVKRSEPIPHYGSRFKNNMSMFQTSLTPSYAINGHKHNRRFTDKINNFLTENDDIINLVYQLDANKRKVVAEIIRAIKT